MQTNLKESFSQYTQIQPVKRVVVEPSTPRQFEILDLETMTKEIKTVAKGVELEEEQKPKKTKTRTSKQTFSEQEASISNQIQENDTTEVVFKFDMFESSLFVSEVYRDDSVVCLFYRMDAPYKVKPKAGASFVISVEGEDISVYSPGVYVPLKTINKELAFFLVKPDKEE